MGRNDTCPFVVKGLSREENGLIEKFYSRHEHDYVHVGEAGYLLPSLFQEHAADITNMPLRATDIFVVSFPRSGTTWTQELVWLIANDLDFETASAVPFFKRAPFIEYPSFLNPKIREIITQMNDNTADVRKIFDASKTPAHQVFASSADPRLIKTHLPISLLPQVLDTGKVVYVARDPRDVMVSCYHFYRNHYQFGLKGEFQDFFELFIRDLVPWGPYFEHVKEAWALRPHSNMMFLFYEELSKDLSCTARRVASFLNKSYSDKQISNLCEFLSFDNFQKSNAINPPLLKYLLQQTDQNNFIRRGKAGGWRDYFDEKMSLRADAWIRDNTKDTDLQFPQHCYEV